MTVPHKSPPGTIDMTPSPAAYEQICRMIIRNSVNPNDREHAADEMVRIQPALKRGWWHKPDKECDCLVCRDWFNDHKDTEDG